MRAIIIISMKRKRRRFWGLNEVPEVGQTSLHLVAMSDFIAQTMKSDYKDTSLNRTNLSAPLIRFPCNGSDSKPQSASNSDNNKGKRERETELECLSEY